MIKFIYIAFVSCCIDKFDYKLFGCKEHWTYWIQFRRCYWSKSARRCIGLLTAGGYVLLILRIGARLGRPERQGRL
jgi:hypothetical protein